MSEQSEISIQEEPQSNQVESPSVVDKLQDIVDRWKAATTSQDLPAIAKLQQEIADDPMLTKLLQENNIDIHAPVSTGEAVKEVEELDVTQVMRAVDQFADNLDNILRLGFNATQRNAPTESIFKDSASGNEFQSAQTRLTKLRESIASAKTKEAVTNAFQEFNSWFTKVQQVVPERLGNLKGYFGGYLPDELAAQARLFDQSVQNYQTLNQIVEQL